MKNPEHQTFEAINNEIYSNSVLWMRLGRYTRPWPGGLHITANQFIRRLSESQTHVGLNSPRYIKKYLLALRIHL